MKLICRYLPAPLGALLLALAYVPNAAALCGAPAHKAPASLRLSDGRPHLLLAGLTASDDWAENRHDDRAGIVGFWHVKFISQGSEGIPDGPVDAGYAVWHSDGTEIMNSGGRAPITGDFCLGVWKQVGERRYKLNHFAAAWDPTGKSLLGPANIHEDVILARNGNEFSGSFTIDQYTEAGALVVHIKGSITGTRITLSTPSESVF